jgi:Ca-activated chloride channel homolog
MLARALWLALPAMLLTGVSGGAELQVPTDYQISVDVNLVMLQATVKDRKGQSVADLQQRDFEVYEDGVRQSIRLFHHEDVPVTVGLVIDHSGSMHRKMADVILAARSFVLSSRPDDDMFVVNFNDLVTVDLPDANSRTSRIDQLERAILTTPVVGMTRLYDAVVAAQDQLRSAKQKKKVLIVISDGGDNASTHDLAEVLKQASNSEALVYTIGIFDEEDAESNSNALRRLARATGGEAFSPRASGDVAEICERIARDIRSQYAIGYVSANPPKAGTWHSIRVTGAGDLRNRLVVRTRSGYTTEGIR